MTIIFRQLIDGLYLQTKEWKIDLWLDQCRRKRMAMKKKARVIYLCVNYFLLETNNFEDRFQG